MMEVAVRNNCCTGAQLLTHFKTNQNSHLTWVKGLKGMDKEMDKEIILDL